MNRQDRRNILYVLCGGVVSTVIAVSLPDWLIIKITYIQLTIIEVALLALMFGVKNAWDKASPVFNGFFGGDTHGK